MSYEMRYITRMDYPRNPKSWWVRFYKNNKLFKHKTFIDSHYIDRKEESLFYAKQWRDDAEKQLIKNKDILPYCEGRVGPIRTTIRSNNKSDVNGVFRCDYITTKAGRPFHMLDWRCTWVEYIRVKNRILRKCKTKNFAIRKHSEDGAFKLACDHRNEIQKYLTTPEHVKLRNEYIKLKLKNK